MTTATAAAARAALITDMTLLFTGACTQDASRDGPGRATSTGATPATEFGSAEPTGHGAARKYRSRASFIGVRKGAQV
jgi:hypothetical protein